MIVAADGRSDFTNEGQFLAYLRLTHPPDDHARLTVRRGDQRAKETILPHALQEFLDFNDFLEVADAMVEELDLGGILQVASFHPQFQFEGTEADEYRHGANGRES